jgi:hypothetical protein
MVNQTLAPALDRNEMRMYKVTFAFSALAASLLLMGCGDAASDAPEASTGLDSPDRALAWAPEELYSVGGFEGTDWQEFGTVAAVGFDATGNLYVLDDQASTITVVSPAGEHVRTFGGPGEGPGELASPMGMTVLPDGRVVIPDFGHQGFVIFGSNGEWQENLRLDLTTEGMPNGGVYHPSGALIAPQGFRMMSSRTASDEPEEEPNTRPMRTYSLDSENPGRQFYGAWDPPDPPEGGETTLEGGESGSRMMIQMSRLRAFEPGLSYTVLPDGLVAVVDSLDYTVKLVSLDGTVTGRLQRPIPPTPVTAAIRDAERERQLAAATEGGGLRLFGTGGGMSFDEEAIQDMMVERVDGMMFFEVIPVIEAIKADWGGRIWVQRSSGIPGEDGPTDLITKDGSYLGTLPADGVRIPSAFGPDGLIAVVEKDDLDVPVIRVLRVPTEG